MEITNRQGTYYEETEIMNIFEAHENGQLIGEMYLDINTGQIMQIEVNEDRRGEGIARAIYEYACSITNVYHAPDEHCTREGLAFKNAVGGEEIDPETAYQP